MEIFQEIFLIETDFDTVTCGRNSLGDLTVISDYHKKQDHRRKLKEVTTSTSGPVKFLS